MEQNITTHSKEETRNFGKKLASEILPGTLLCLRGDLGAGKTTLVQGLLEGLGANRPYVSPTFVIMKQYELGIPGSTGITRVYHADAYRVGTRDFTEIGFAEWCADPQGIVIVEWPERIMEILPEKRIDIMLTSISETDREIAIKEKTAKI